jgi:hypothetical protein
MKLAALRVSRPLPPRIFLLLISDRGRVHSRAILRLEGLGQLQNPMTSSGIATVTFRLVIASTNYATACPPYFLDSYICRMKCTEHQKGITNILIQRKNTLKYKRRKNIIFAHSHLHTSVRMIAHTDAKVNTNRPNYMIYYSVT